MGFKNTTRRNSINSSEQQPRHALEFMKEECISDKAGCSRNKTTSPELEKEKSNSMNTTNSLVASSTCNDPPKPNSTERIKNINSPGSEFIERKSSGLSSRHV